MSVLLIKVLFGLLHALRILIKSTMLSALFFIGVAVKSKHLTFLDLYSNYMKSFAIFISAK